MLIQLTNNTLVCYISNDELKQCPKTDYYNMMNNYFISKLHKSELEEII